MRNRFDQQLELLNKQLIHMGELCEEAIGKATTALKEGSMEQAEKVRIADEEIDQAETDIERLCLRLLLQQQPVARDLRQISAALKMITDMERIGDQASDIAEIIITEDKSEAQDIPMIIKMSEAASKMVRDRDVYKGQVKQVGDVKGMNIAVLGAGPIGNLVAQAAKGMGAAKVMITDVSDLRLDKAKECGIDVCVNTKEKDFGEDVYKRQSHHLRYLPAEA